MAIGRLDKTQKFKNHALWKKYFLPSLKISPADSLSKKLHYFKKLLGLA